MESFDIHERYYYTTFYVVQLSFDTLLITIFVGMLRFATGWFELEARRKQMENDKLMNELKFLKAQINPHFLFNTLNNLYFLAYSQSPNTTEVIAKLSQMMRYMIYDSNYQQVLLTKEIEYMKNYINLERLRLNNEVPIDFIIEGETENKLITPLIFITFLENAFKHGMGVDEPFIQIHLTANNGKLEFDVKNKFANDLNESKDASSGIGLENVQSRLMLLYPKEHDLILKEENNLFHVHLTLQLK